MRRRNGSLLFYLFLLLFVGFYFIACGHVFAKSINWVTSYDEAIKTAKAEKKNVVIDFYTEW